MAGLFGKNKLKEMAQGITTDDVMQFIEIVKTWHKDYEHGTLKSDKETSREQAYNRDFFINILGYTEKPADPWSFEPKATTEKGQLPDAVISYKGESIAAVVELKGASIPLDRPQQREGNMSPVQQGFKYKTQYRRCPFVIVSNFYEFRLYQDNQLDYEVWSLDDLVNPDDDYISFKSWYILLKAENFIAKTGISMTESILSEIRIDQEAISNKFYQEYKNARLDLLRDLWKKNEEVRYSIDFGINKAQKIVDRLVFVFFAEDRGLLPDNILMKVIESAKNSAFGGSIWNVLKAFFDAIDMGSEKLEIPDGYNGGLFKSDAELNNLRIGDEVLLKLAELGKYDFVDDLSVEILGHIFEQSISDLEEIKAKVKEGDDFKDLAISRRKRDGIFYTPGYIVRYIVDNSLGAYLREHEEKFKKEVGLKENIQDINYTKREHQAYFKYQKFLQEIKVLDPACGSGAFLVYVFDYLLAENKRVDHILGNTLFGLDGYVKNILQNNIYGVDLNEESVEITKLSLWLKTAQKGKHLAAMDSNIKCGNSLIDDPEVAGNKAFDWQKEFPEIFANGGFDVVVMNPPYVDSESMTLNIPEQRAFLAKYFVNTAGNWDLYIPFIELAFNLIKDGGYTSFITPDKWIAKPFGEATRTSYMPYFSRIAFAGREVFSDAKVDSVITTIYKKQTKTLTSLDAKETNFPTINSVKKDIIQPPYTLDFLISNNLSIIDKIDKNRAKVSDYAVCDGSCATSDAYKLKDLVEDSRIVNDGFMRMINTGTISKFVSRWGYSPMTYLGDKYLTPVINTTRFANEFGNSYYRKAIQPKLIIKGMTLLDICPDFDAQIVPGKTTILLISEDENNLRFLLVLLNSQLPIFYIKQKYSASSYNGGITFTKEMIGGFPIANFSDKEREFMIKTSQSYINLHSKLQENSHRFMSLVMNEFSIDKAPSKISTWYYLDFSDFTKALKTKLSLTQKDDLLELWNKYQPQLAALDAEIKALDKEIDQKVYELYGLTPEEIAIVEEAY